MIVYVDIVLLTNFILDAALLLTTASVRRIRPNVWRLAASSALGASYALFMFLPSMSVFYTFLVKCLFSVLMIMTAFGFKTVQRFAGTLLTFYGVNAAAAGTVMALHYLTQSSNEVWSGIVFSQTGSFHYTLGISLWFVVLAGGVGIAVYRAVHAGAKRKEVRETFLAEVDVEIDGESCRCTGLIDTGNHLYDPLTRTPVMVVEAAQWSDVLPESWMNRIKRSEVDQLVAGIGEDSFIWQDRLRLIPYRGVNRGTQFMLALKPDKVVIVRNETEIVNEKVLVGLDGGKLCADGSYQAIIHPTLAELEA